MCEFVSAVCMCWSLEASVNEASELFASYELQLYVVKFIYLFYGNDDGKNLIACRLSLHKGVMCSYNISHAY